MTKTSEERLKDLNWRIFTFNNDTVIDSKALTEIRETGKRQANPPAWHLYCDDWWTGGDLSVFQPIADLVKRISLPCEKGTKVIGLDCLVNVETMAISGDLSEVDFTRFNRLRSLNVNEGSSRGNWHLCRSLDHLLIDVPISNLAKLKSLKNLRSLSVGRGLKSFEGIADLPALRELRVGGCHLASLDSLGKLPQLQLLLLNLMPKLTNLNGIEGLSGLEDLSVTQCGCLQDVSTISALTRLKKLELNCCPHIKSVDNLKLPAGCTIDFVSGGKVGDAFRFM